MNFHCIYIFWVPAAPATERKRRKHCYWESLAAAQAQSWVTAPQKQSRLFLPQSERITSGRDRAADCIPNELTSFKYLLLEKEWVLKWLNLAACSAVQHTVSKRKSQMTLKMSPLLLQETLLCSFRMKESLSAHGPLGTSRCWQSFRPAAAKLAFQEEMVNMAAFCHRGGRWGGVPCGFKAPFACGENGK